MAADPEYVDDVLWAIRRVSVAAGAALVAFVFLLWLGSLAGWSYLPADGADAVG